MEKSVWWSWKGAPDEDTSHPVPVDEETQLLFVQEALGWGKVVIQGSFFQTHGLLYSQVGHCIQVAMGRGSSQNIFRCKIFQVDLCKPIAEPVAAALAVYDNLKKLKLCELNIDLVTVHAIFDALQSNTGLQTLVLDSVYLEDEAWTVVGRALARNKTLQHLKLRRTLSPTGLEAVCTIIINNKSLKSLDISDNRIGDEGMMHLLKALTVNRSIERVVLSSNSFGDHGAHILAKVVQQSSTLVLLDVDSNNIGKMGARELGPALAANSTLQVLRLSRNFLDDASVAAIAAAAGRHKKLEQLDLSFNRMGPEGVHALAQHIISPSRSVDSLLLHGNCMIGSDGALHLAKVLPRARKLTRLDLSDCEISDKGAVALAKGLARNKSLLDFRIAHNQITHEGAAAFAAALRSNKTLKYFDFSFNWVGHRGIAPLKEVQAQVADRCHMVWELSLEYCQIEKFKYGDYTTQPDDTSTQQDQQDNPLSTGEAPWTPRSEDPSENDTHVTSTLTAVSENRLEGDSVRPPLSTPSLSLADGAHGPHSGALPDPQTSDPTASGMARGISNINEIQAAPLPSFPSGPDRADSFESVSLGGVPPSPMGDDAEGSTPVKLDARIPFQRSLSGLRREAREDVTVAAVLPESEEFAAVQPNGYGHPAMEDISIIASDLPMPGAVRTVSTAKAAQDAGLPSPYTAEMALASPQTLEQSSPTTSDVALAAADDAAQVVGDQEPATSSGRGREEGNETIISATQPDVTHNHAEAEEEEDQASSSESNPTDEQQTAHTETLTTSDAETLPPSMPTPETSSSQLEEGKSAAEAALTDIPLVQVSPATGPDSALDSSELATTIPAESADISHAAATAEVAEADGATDEPSTSIAVDVHDADSAKHPIIESSNGYLHTAKPTHIPAAIKPPGASVPGEADLLGDLGSDKVADATDQVADATDTANGVVSEIHDDKRTVADDMTTLDVIDLGPAPNVAVQDESLL